MNWISRIGFPCAAAALLSVVHADAPVRVLSVTGAEARSAAQHPVESGPPHVRVISMANARSSEQPVFLSADRQLQVVVKRFEKVSLQLTDWPIDELMLIRQGRVRLIESSGNAKLFGPGEVLILPRGFSGKWEQLAAVEMITVSYGQWH